MRIKSHHLTENIMASKNYKSLKRSKILPLLEAFLNRHEDMKNAYFMRPPSSAAERRQMERREQLQFKFTLNGRTYEFEQHVSCTCKNVYYYKTILIDGESKNIRALKKLLTEYGTK